jgi:hypothetical protein
MTPDQTTELMQRIFAVNEQIVRQNHEILSVLTNPRITKDAGRDWKALRKKEWVGLTDEEIEDYFDDEHFVYARNIERLLKEKNT